MGWLLFCLFFQDYQEVKIINNFQNDTIQIYAFKTKLHPMYSGATEKDDSAERPNIDMLILKSCRNVIHQHITFKYSNVINYLY